MTQTASATVPSSFITLKYLGAVVSTVLAVVTSVGAISQLIGLWANKSSGVSPVYGLLGVLGLSNDLIFLSVAGIGFSVLAFFLYRCATKAIATRVSYLQTTAYVVITNAFVAVMAMMTVLFAIDIATVAVSSLLLIGKSVDIGAMYLTQFLPSMIGLGVVGFAGLMGYQIAKGRNKSFVLTLVIMTIAAAVLVAVCITVPIKKNYYGGSLLKSTSSSSLSEIDLKEILPDTSKNKSKNDSRSGSKLDTDSYDDFDFDSLFDY